MLPEPVRLWPDHLAFVEVVLSNRHEAAFAAFSEAVARVPGIGQAHMIAGSFNNLVRLRISYITGH